MRHLDLFTDIGAPTPFAPTFAEGLLALLAERPGASRTRIPDESVPKPAPKPVSKPRPTTPPKPKPPSPPSKPTPARSTPTKSTDQAKKGVTSNRPPKSPPAAPPAPRPVPKSRPAAPAPKPPTKPRPTPPKPATETRPSKPSGYGRTKPSETTSRPAKTSSTPTSSKPGSSRPTSTKPGTGTPSKVRGGGPTSTPTKAGITAPTKTAGSSPPSKSKTYSSRPSTRGETIDAQLTPQERDRILADQRELEEREREIRENNRPSTPVPVQPGQRPNRFFIEEQREIDRQREETAEEQIREEREEYFEEHEYYIDANGTAYVANYDATTGDIELEREEENPPQGNNPRTTSRSVHRIHTDRSRTNSVATTANTTENGVQVEHVRTETQEVDPQGNVRGSQIAIDQTRENRDGSTERSHVEENYDARGTATTRVQRQETEFANGDSDVNETTTHFASDGQTQTQVRSTSEQTRGDDVSTRATTTYYRPDGTTPRSQSVVEGGTTADGERKPQTTALTDYDSTGEPASTFIRREAPRDPLSATEYIVWGEDNEIRNQYEGGEHVSEFEYERFHRDGTPPDQQDVPDAPREPSLDDFYEYDGSGHRYPSASGTNAQGQTWAEAMDSYESAHAAWEDERDEVEAFNDQSTISELDPSEVRGGEDAIRYTRGDDNRFDGEGLQGNLVEPLEPATSTPSVFTIPAEVRAHANAEAIDSSPAATDPAVRERLDSEQRAFERDLAGATTDAERERLMSAYFADHDYWIDRGGEGEDPVLMAAAWSEGMPSSTMFGGDRAADPHATMARTGIEGRDDVGNPATIDVVTNMYVDGSRDDITRTSHDGPAGAERTVVTGDHTNPQGVVVEHDVHAESMVPRTEQGLPPLAVTEITRERFDERSGKPEGEQYYAVATSDAQSTTLEEKRDWYNADGIKQDTDIESVQMSRNYDAELTEDFLEQNQAVIDDALDGGLNVNEVGTSITVPPAGSYYTHETTDIDYDASGQPIFQQTDTETTTVADAGDENHNGVRVTTTDTTKTIGERGGHTVIFDEDGTRLVDEDVVTTISTNEFDPDAGSAGGNNGTGFQARESTTITLGKTIRPDGTATDEWATPLTTQTLLEGHDDDWVADEKHLKTNAQGELVNEDGDPLHGEGDDAKPVELEEGDRVYDREGNRVDLPRGSHHEEDLDFSDKFEEFMEGWGGKIVGVAGVVVGVALIATGVGSPLGVALAAGGVALASTQFAYTALNYSQGEASGWDLAIAGAGVGLSALPALAGVRTLATTGRAANAARGVTGAAGSVDDIARGTAGTALRGGGSAGGSRAFDATLRGGNAAGNGLDAYDGYEATRAALRGDFYGAALMLGAIGGGVAVGRVRGAGGRGGPNPTDPASSVPNNPADAPDIPTGVGGDRGPGLPDSTIPAPAPLNPGRPGSTNSGAPSVRVNDTSSNPGAGPRTQPLPGTNTSDTGVAGARGEGADAGPAPRAVVEAGSEFRGMSSETADSLAAAGFPGVREGITRARQERLEAAGVSSGQRMLLPDGAGMREGDVIDVSADGSTVLIREYLDSGDLSYRVYDLDAVQAANTTSLAAPTSAAGVPALGRGAEVAAIEASMRGAVPVPGTVRTLKPWSSGASGEAVTVETVRLADGTTMDVVRKTANSGATQEHAAWELAKAYGVDAYLPTTVRLPNGDTLTQFVDGAETREVAGSDVLAAAEANVRSRHPELDDAAVTAQAQTDLELLHYLDYTLGNHDHQAGLPNGFVRNTMIDSNGALRVIDFGSSSLVPGDGVQAPNLSAAARERLATSATPDRLGQALDHVSPVADGALSGTRRADAPLLDGTFRDRVLADVALRTDGIDGGPLPAGTNAARPAGADRGREIVNSTPETPAFTSDAKLLEHYVKHRLEFNGEHAIDGVSVTNPAEYQARATELVSAARAGDARFEFAMNETTGNAMVLNRDTGEVVVLTGDGRIASLHRMGMPKEFVARTYALGLPNDLPRGLSHADARAPFLDGRLYSLDARRTQMQDITNAYAVQRTQVQAEIAAIDAKIAKMEANLAGRPADDPVRARIEEGLAAQRAQRANKLATWPVDNDAAWATRVQSSLDQRRTTFDVARPTGPFDATAAYDEFVLTSQQTGVPTGRPITEIQQPHGMHGPMAEHGASLPDTDMAGPNVPRINDGQGNTAVVYGRLPDGNLIIGDGMGNRRVMSPHMAVIANAGNFAPRSFPPGSRVSVPRTDGTIDHDWNVLGFNADGTVTVQSFDRNLRKQIPATDLYFANAHRMLGDVNERYARVHHADGSVSDGWVPLRTEHDLVTLARTRQDGSVEYADMSTVTFLSANGDRILGTVGAYPGTPVRRGLGGAHDTPDFNVREGVDFHREGAGAINDAGGYLFRGGIAVQHGNVRIRVESDPGTPSLAVRQRVEAIMQAIDAMPAEMRMNIRHVNVLEGRNPQDSYWAQQTGDENFLSGATASRDTVNMFYGTRGDVTALFGHEATHTFGMNGGPFHRDQWEWAMAMDAAHLSQLPHRDRIRPQLYGMQLNSPAISGYAQLQYDGAVDATGRRNVNEDWAETGGFTIQGERNGGVVATRRRWWGGTQNYTMQDLFPNRAATLDHYRQWAQQHMYSPSGYSTVGAAVQPRPNGALPNIAAPGMWFPTSGTGANGAIGASGGIDWISTVSLLGAHRYLPNFSLAMGTEQLADEQRLLAEERTPWPTNH